MRVDPGTMQAAETKIHGLLVPLSSSAASFEALARGGVFAADGMTLRVVPEGEASVSENRRWGSRVALRT